MSLTEEALARFRTVLDENGVVTERSAIQDAETATFETSQKIPLILRPSTREQVQQCMRIASKDGVAVYPISGGKNWGYGSRVPAADGCVLLDLSRMNRILDFSEEHAYVTVEPGVTQRQLYQFLQERGGKLYLDCTGASPDCSVVGNTVERGFGHTPYGDRFAQISNLEVVLPTGDCIETGFGRYGDIAAKPTYRWGIGPILDGLFTQSNFGVVTRVTLWLMPAPEYFQAFFFRCDTAEGLAPLVDALRPLRLDGTLRSAAHIGNHYKVISAMQQYPWDRMQGQTPLQGEVLRDLCREFDIGAWNGSGALYGTRAQVAEARRLLKRALAGKVSKIRFLDDRTLGWAERFAGPAKWLTGWDLRRVLELLRPVYGLMKGAPTDHSLRSVYWRRRGPVPADMNPDRDRCGLLWCAPVAPISGPHADRIAALSSRILLEHGFEPMLSITLLTERTLACVISITYDRDVPGEDTRAADCYRKLADYLVSAGYHFYRLGIQGMYQMQVESSYSTLLSTLKHTLDPAGVLAPRRYDPELRTAKAVSRQT